MSNLSVKAAYNDKTYAFADVAVIGAGPAGLNAALLAANAGAGNACRAGAAFGWLHELSRL